MHESERKPLLHGPALQHCTFKLDIQETERDLECLEIDMHLCVIQAVFFGICVLTDLSSLLTKGNDSQEQERQLKKLISLRDWVMAVLAFPVGVFVVTMFWSIYIYDRELVYPKLLDNFIPAWLNHGMEPSGIQQVSGAEVPLRLGWIFHSLLTFWSLVCLRWSCKTEPQKGRREERECLFRILLFFFLSILFPAFESSLKSHSKTRNLRVSWGTQLFFLDFPQKFYIPPAVFLTSTYRPVHRASPCLIGGSEGFCSAVCT
uniref:Androgen induced 1 n=1 Tax=Falco tinnunculus TaxID=100819 RepID=A0A8C4V137_FALTI